MLNYALKGIKWTDDPITWSLATFSYSSDPSVPFSSTIAATYQQTVMMAALTWESVANVTFQQIADSGDPTQATDIRVGFGDISNGSEIGLTAYQFAGTSFLPDVSIFLEDPALDPLIQNADGSFTYQGTTTELFQVLLHEMGHALGLDHSTDPNAVMYPSLGPQNRTLDASDIAGIDAIYGTNATVTPDSLGIPVFRFYNPVTGARFFTDSKVESGQAQATGGWKLEGIGFNGVNPATNDPNAAPVFRFDDTRTGDHFFTISQSEMRQVLNTLPAMKLEGIAFDEDVSARPGDLPVYRLYDSGSGAHLYTSSVAEKTAAISGDGMKLEGIAFYAPT
jgi:predicted Zn-dependent protease